MGVAITEILSGKEFDFHHLQGKVLAIDAYNTLYQFLTILRGADGAPLMNEEGKITSHLLGLLTRNIQLLSYGCKLIFVFDGKPPELKMAERRRRKELKEEAKKQYEIAKERNDFESMRKFSSRMVTVDEEIVTSAKKLLTNMGVACIDAKSEGEAQVARLICEKKADYAVSQDADALLFGAPMVIRNLSIGGRKRLAGSLKTVAVEPMIYSLDNTLKDLEITREQLIALAMLTGTDYNVGGIKGIGPKKGLKLIKKHGADFDALFREVEWDKNIGVQWKVIMDLFLHAETADVEIKFPELNPDGIRELLVGEYAFDETRISQHLLRFEELKSKRNQKGLSDFF